MTLGQASRVAVLDVQARKIRGYVRTGLRLFDIAIAGGGNTLYVPTASVVQLMASALQPLTRGARRPFDSRTYQGDNEELIRRAAMSLLGQGLSSSQFSLPGVDQSLNVRSPCHGTRGPP